jgi:hypothetical protein
MKLVKSLLLGSAAGLAAVAGANAADLPARKAVAAVEYVRVCSTYGAGFFYIPGTESCLRIGGRVRADALYAEPFSRDRDAFGIRVRGRIQADVRTATAYGLLRTFVRFEIQQNSGSPFGQTGTFSTNNANVAQAFVQFGGLTAGKVTSFWDNPDLPTQHFGTLRFSDAPDIALFAYTFSFGNGFSATISAEDGVERRSGLTPFNTAAGSNYAGQNMPDIVGNVRYAGTWGSAQLNAAVHQTRGLVIPVATPAGTVGVVPDTEYGWAVGGSVGINLPMIGAGDAAWVAAQYADGALGYITGGQSSGITNGTTTGVLNDVFYNFANADTSRGRGWSIAGGFTHNWTPTVRSSIFGSWADINYSGSINAPIALGGAGVPDFREYRIGGNVIWSPVSGLNLGLEVIYANIDVDRRGVLRLPGANDSGTEGRIRVQRDF